RPGRTAKRFGEARHLGQRAGQGCAGRKNGYRYCWFRAAVRRQASSARPMLPRSIVALRVVLDAAVKRIREPNLPRIRQDYQSIPLRGVKINRADQGEAVEDKRQAASGDRVRLVNKA